MHRSSPRPRRTTVGVLVLAVLLAAVGCGQGQQSEPVNLEGVSTAGDNPFSPPVGTDQAAVTPPPGAGGTFAGDTVGLFGGTQNQSTCDKAKLSTFLQQEPAKAAAFAGVLGIAVSDLQSFVATLTPAILRSDTRVTNHGFRDGRAVEIPAVLQAGTAVLVDVHGVPVTKCFCGNPLTLPKQQRSETFKGPQWSNFASTEVTVIAPVTQTVQQFVFVEPASGHSFQRPAGTAGRQDVAAPSPAPTTFGPTTSAPVRTVTGTAGPPGTSPPPGVVVPSPSVPVSPPAPSGATPRTPSGTRTPTGPATSATSATVPPSPTAPSAPSVTVSPSGSPTQPPAPPPLTPSPPATSAPPATPPPTVSPTATPTVSPSATPSPSVVVRASWVVGDCFVRDGVAHGTVLVRTDDPAPHRFRATVRLGTTANPVAVETVQVATVPGQVGQAEVTAQTPTPNGSVQCAVLSIVDEDTGVVPVQGEPLPPPPDSVPMPAQPGPGAPSGPSVPATPPPPVVPGGTPS